jgi:hydrogenase expression/formation protein HypC
MCVGTPFRLDAAGEFEALGVGRHETRRLSLLLTGPLPAGAFVLAQGELAIRPIEADEALLIDDALDACRAAEAGEDFESGFADLIDRTPRLPDWLLAEQAAAQQSNDSKEPSHG